MRVHSFTSTLNRPSSRFRIRQFAKALSVEGIQLEDHSSGPDNLLYELMYRIHRHTISFRASTGGPGIPWGTSPVIENIAADDTLWLERDYFPLRYLHSGNFRVMELDDAIWLQCPAVSEQARRVDRIQAGNQFLADWASLYCDDVRIVPTVVDLDRYAVSPLPQDGPFVIGWTGLAGNYPYFKMIEEALGRFMKETDAKLIVLSNRPPHFALPSERVEYYPWSPQRETELLQKIHVGIMPLPNRDWERGKCSFKLLQYMAASRAVIASPVGMNCEILSSQPPVGFSASNPDEWFEALRALEHDRGLAQEQGINGRRLVEQKYSLQKLAPVVAENLRP